MFGAQIVAVALARLVNGAGRRIVQSGPSTVNEGNAKALAMKPVRASLPCGGVPHRMRWLRNLRCRGNAYRSKNAHGYGGSMSFAPTAATHKQVLGSHAPREFLGPTRPGRRFEPVAERLLDSDLMTLSMRLPNASRGVAFVREFSGGRGVADAVAVTSWHKGVLDRMALGLPFLLNETDCSIVAAMAANQTRTLSVIARKLGMSESQLTRRLRPLVAGGYVEARGSGYRRVRGLEPIGRSYALEAKVSDWRQGISQALRYSAWCDAAAIVLLRDPRDLDEVRRRCSSLGLGFASDGRWVVRPRIGRPNTGLRLVASELFAQQAVESQSF